MAPTRLIEVLGQEDPLQKHKKRVENLPEQDLIRACTDAGFMKTVEVAQHL